MLQIANNDKLGPLVGKGATVMASKPLKSPGLSGFPDCDADVGKIAEEVWGKNADVHAFGAGRVISGRSVEAALEQLALAPDCETSPGNTPLPFIHRRIGEAEVYLVSNQESRARSVVCAFRVAGRQPELWDAEAGTIADAACWSIEKGRTSVTLDLEQSGSVFVVFRRPVIERASLMKSFTEPPARAPFHTPVLEMLSASYGSLQSGPGLADVTEPLRRLIRDGRLETIDYRDFAGDPSPNMAKKMRVDYTIGGQPHTVTVTEHQILQLPEDIEWAGLPLKRWPDWLLKGSARTVAQRGTFTTWHHWRKDSQLLPSGLLGPVMLRPLAVVPVAGRKLHTQIHITNRS